MAETGKQLRSSGSSSDEISDPTRDEGASTTLKRSFECTYCKRGFTNAQALGGHMNIHRKDRAKAKQTTTAATKKGNIIYSDDPNNYMMSCRQITPIETGYANWEAPGMMSSPAAILSSGVLLNNTMPAAGEYHRPPQGPGHHYWEPNLSLRVGPATASNNTEDHDNHEEAGKNEDVDLELRLGPR